jgi:hypothetical protein
LRFEGGRTSPWGGGGGGSVFGFVGGVVAACIVGNDPPFMSSSRFRVVPLFVVVSLRAPVGPPPPPPAALKTFMCARVVAVGPPLCVWGRGDGTLQGGRLGAGWSVSVECTPKASPCTKASYACIELIRVEPLSFGRYDWYTGRMSIVSCVVW